MAYKRISPQPVIEGGTGATTLTAHGVLLGEGTSAITPTAVGTNGQVLVGSSAADPGWVTPTAGTGLSVTANASTHSYALSTPVSVANGGTGDTSLTAYAVLCGGTTSTGAIQSIASVGTSGQFLTSNGAGALPTFQTAGAASITITGDTGGGLTGSSFTFTGGSTGLTFAGSGTTETLGGTLVVSNGGTGAATLTSHSLLLGNGTSAISALGAATNGQIPIGNTGNAPSLATITAGSNITVTNGAGSITIAATSGTSFSTASVTLTSAQVKALHATPITIVAAPGAGKMVMPMFAECQLNYGGNNAFVNGGGASLDLYFTNSSGPNATGTTAFLFTSAGITATANTLAFIPCGLGNVTASSNCTNAALVVSQSSATEITGNAAGDNTIDITVWYMTITP